MPNAASLISPASAPLITATSPMHLMVFGPSLPKAPTLQAARVSHPPLHSSELCLLCAAHDWLCLWHPLPSAVSLRPMSITDANC